MLDAGGAYSYIGEQIKIVVNNQSLLAARPATVHRRPEGSRIGPSTLPPFYPFTPLRLCRSHTRGAKGFELVSSFGFRAWSQGQSYQTNPIRVVFGPKTRVGGKTNPIRAASRGRGRSGPGNPKQPYLRRAKLVPAQAGKTRSSKQIRNPKGPNDQSAPNKANCPRFWPENEGCVEEQSQSKPIRRLR